MPLVCLLLPVVCPSILVVGFKGGCLAQMDQGRSRKHVEALHLRIKEYRQELALFKKEAKRAAKALKHAEVRLNCAHKLVRVSAGLSPPASACVGVD